MQLLFLHNFVNQFSAFLQTICGACSVATYTSRQSRQCHLSQLVSGNPLHLPVQEHSRVHLVGHKGILDYAKVLSYAGFSVWQLSLWINGMKQILRQSEWIGSWSQKIPSSRMSLKKSIHQLALLFIRKDHQAYILWLLSDFSVQETFITWGWIFAPWPKKPLYSSDINIFCSCICTHYPWDSKWNS